MVNILNQVITSNRIRQDDALIYIVPNEALKMQFKTTENIPEKRIETYEESKNLVLNFNPYYEEGKHTIDNETAANESTQFPNTSHNHTTTKRAKREPRKKIPFSVDISAKRNVDKYIVRNILRKFPSWKDEILWDYKIRGISSELFDNSYYLLNEIKNQDRDKTIKKRDYKKVILTMIETPLLLDFLECGLKKIDHEYSIGNFGCIKPENKKIYASTIKDYLSYVSKIKLNSYY